jgi:hypothetical protein
VYAVRNLMVCALRLTMLGSCYDVSWTGHMAKAGENTRGGLISLWLYKENNKLRDRKNIFTLHIPPELHTLMTSLF